MKTLGRVLGVGWAITACAVIAFSLLPRLAGYQMLIVRSGSMEPTIRTGSTVLVQPVAPATLRVGDVITYERADGPPVMVTHRIVEVLNAGPPPTFRTKGDANDTEDPYTVTFHTTGGKVIFAMPFAGYFYNALALPAVRLVLIGVPVVYLSGAFLRDIWKRAR
jgi:signal peptidase